MKFFKKALMVLTACVMATSVWAMGERIIVVSHGQANDAFWTRVKNAVEIAGKEMGVRVEYRAPETYDMVQMAQLIEAAIQQEPDALIVSLPDKDALGPAIQKAVRAGIPVASMNSGSGAFEELGILFHVGQDEYEAGVAAGKRMKTMGVKNLICINHEVGNVALDRRCQGVADGYGGDVEVIPTSANDPQVVYEKAKATLTANPDIDGIMTLGAGNSAEPTLKAMKELKRTDIKLGTFDLSANVLKDIEKGEIAFAIDQQQFLQGYLPVVYLTLNHRYKTLPGSNKLPTGPGFVTKDNASDVIELSAKGLR